MHSVALLLFSIAFFFFFSFLFLAPLTVQLGASLDGEFITAGDPFFGHCG
jgi:hypothetical protein